MSGLPDPVTPEFPALIVAAHADDETMGMAGSILRWRRANPDCRISVAILTDGTPLDRAYFANGGSWTHAEYRSTRRREAACALGVLGIAEHDIAFSSIADQQLALRLREGWHILATLAERVGVRSVFVPAYEGGHPDHDAANFLASVLVHRTLALAAWEYPLYTADGGEIRRCQFVDGHDVVCLELTDEERKTKQRALACYASQRETLSYFPVGPEWLRRLQAHDYTRPAVHGPAVYELWGWPVRAAEVSQQFAQFAAEIAGA